MYSNYYKLFNAVVALTLIVLLVSCFSKVKLKIYISLIPAYSSRSYVARDNIQ